MHRDQDDHSLTWAALLGHWAEFAKSALALPDDAQGRQWRDAVVWIISLQAVTFALGDLDRIERDERALGLDRAEILIRECAAKLHEIWRGEPLPERLGELIGDARLTFKNVSQSGVEWLLVGETATVGHPAELAGALVAMGFVGDLYLPVPGQTLFTGSPIAFMSGVDGQPPQTDVVLLVSTWLDVDADPEFAPEPRQVYRQFDFAAGGPVRDLVVDLGGEVFAGQPLLMLAINQGEIQAVPLPPRSMREQSPVPVVFGAAEAEEGGNGR